MICLPKSSSVFTSYSSTSSEPSSKFVCIVFLLPDTKEVLFPPCLNIPFCPSSKSLICDKTNPRYSLKGTYLFPSVLSLSVSLSLSLSLSLSVSLSPQASVMPRRPLPFSCQQLSLSLVFLLLLSLKKKKFSSWKRSVSGNFRSPGSSRAN